MTEVKFYEEAADELLKFAVIIARSGDKWIFCKHRDRDTWEAPGGEESFGMLYYADVKTFEEELHSEIERIMLMQELPKEWTYPEIQPRLLAEASKRMESGLAKEDKGFIAEFYKFGFVGIMLDWIDRGMKEDYEEIVRKMGITLYGNITNSIANFEQKQKKQQ